MTAPAATTTTLPLQRVTCPCSWSGVRRNPTGRDCPACGGPRERIETLWQVGHGPHQSIIYVLHFHWPYGRLDLGTVRPAARRRTVPAVDLDPVATPPARASDTLADSTPHGHGRAPTGTLRQSGQRPSTTLQV